MLQEIAITPATVVVVALVAAWAAWAVRRLARRGLCDCSDKCGGCGGKGACSCSTHGERTGCAHALLTWHLPRLPSSATIAQKGL